MGAAIQPPRPPAPPRTGSHVVAIVLLSLGLIVLVAGLSVWFGVKFLAQNVKVSVDDSEGRKEVSIRTPIGSLEVKPQVDETRIGLPVYPGATRVEKGESATISVDLPDEKRLRVLAAQYSTTDALDKVREFYKEQLGSRVTKFVDRTPDGKTLFEIKSGSEEKLVSLKRENDDTQISLVRIIHSEGSAN